MDKLEQLKRYVKDELREHKLTFNLDVTFHDLEARKACEFRVKSESNADFFHLVKCDNVHEAAKLVTSFMNGNERDLKRHEKKFTEQAITDKIDPLKSVGIDIIVSQALC